MGPSSDYSQAYKKLNSRKFQMFVRPNLNL